MARRAGAAAMTILGRMEATPPRVLNASFDGQPNRPSMAQRIAKKAVTLWTVAPLYYDRPLVIGRSLQHHRKRLESAPRSRGHQTTPS
jgi:hypothetical protein